MKKDSGKNEDNSIGEEEENEKNIETQTDVVNMEWEGCNVNCQIIAEDKTPDYFSYYNKEKGAEKNINHINGYKKITYVNLYPGIDVVYIFNPKGGVEYSLNIQKEADLSLVKMKYIGKHPSIDEMGDVHISTVFGDIIDHHPGLCTQIINNNAITAWFKPLDENTVSFAVSSNYNKNYALIIDPWTITPSFPNSNKIWNCQTDAAGNVYLYGGDMPLVLRKYTSTNTLLWTYTTGWDSTTYWLGTLITDRAGNSYITSGANGEISKINTGGGLVWYNNPNGLFGPLYEYWHMAFNCDQSQLVISGTELPSPFNTAGFRGAIFNMNLTNGAIANQIYIGYPFGFLNSNIDEGRSICSAPNGNYYFLTLDSIGSVQAALTSIVYKNVSTYNFSYGSPSYTVTGNMGQNNIKATNSFLYTQNGTNVHKRDISTGTIITTQTIPGGGSNNFLGSYSPDNSGIDIDSCGNVYIGSGNQVVKYDANLNQLATFTTPSAVYDVNVNVNGEVIACGNGFAMSIGFSACKPPAPICKVGCAPPGLTTTPVNIKCNGNANGSATVTPSGNAPPYTFSWTPNVSTTGNASGLSAGTYTCTVTDSGGCSAVSIITITEPLAISATVTATPTGCSTSTGAASVIAVGGTGTYTYSWTPSGGTTANATGLSAGTYSVTITDANSCTCTASTVVTGSGGLTATSVQTNIKCAGSNTGSATANVTGGVLPYTYAWSPGGGTNATTSNLSAGTYTCVITDNNGCISSFIITITQPALLTATYQLDSVCRGDTGSFVHAISGGIKPYTYSWSPTNGLSCNNCPSPIFSGTVSTCYIVTVTDSNGCTATSHVCMKVNPMPDVTLIKQSADTVCNTSGAILLFGNPNGGTYSGQGVYGKFFYPDSVPTNQYDLFYYSYTGTNGCTAISKDSVYVSICDGINTITGNNGGITIYPNPNNGEFMIQSSAPSTRGEAAEIFDVLGQLVKYEKLNTKNTLINLGAHANGLYLYKVITSNGNLISVGKIAVQK